MAYHRKYDFLDLSPDVLATILACCAPRDAGRLILTQKRLVVHLRGESELWSQLSLFHAGKFLPARGFYDGPPNTSCHGLLPGPREMFPEAARSCDDALTAALAAAGSDFASTEHTWSLEGWLFWGEGRDDFFIKDVRLQLAQLPTSGPHGAPSLRAFAQWAVAFTCGSCGDAGAATRQCASCGQLLCRSCSVRCGEDEPEGLLPIPWGCLAVLEAEGKAPKRCAFALCGGCHSANSLCGGEEYTPLRQGDLQDMAAPGLVDPLCPGCASQPDAAWARDKPRCLAHVNECICYCYNWAACHECMCTLSTCGAPIICGCSRCSFQSSSACGSTAGGQQHLKICSNSKCYDTFCSVCVPGTACPAWNPAAGKPCGAYLSAFVD